MSTFSSEFHSCAFSRPEVNPDLVGHETEERTLSSVWQQGKLAHAWLISGPRGVGKATLAYRFARFVLSGTKQTSGKLDKCGKSSPLYLPPSNETFRLVAAHSHTDFRVVKRGFNASGQQRTQVLVEDVRSIAEFFYLTPVRSQWRVVIVDDAEMMNESASNALLKVLEEPPKHSLLLLVTHCPWKLPQTIRSRCYLLKLKPLSNQQINLFLSKNLSSFSQSNTSALISLSNGSIGRAIELLRYDGITTYQIILSLLDRFPLLPAKEIYALSERITRGGPTSFTIWGELFTTWLTRLVRFSATLEPMTEILPGESVIANNLASIVKLKQWIAMWEETGCLLRQTEVLNLDRKQTIISVFHSLQNLTDKA